MRAGAFAIALVLLAACGRAPEPAAPVWSGVLLEVPPARVPSPDGSMTLLFGGEDHPSLTLSAGFLRRSAVGEVRTTSWLSWAPDGRHFFVNDSGSASWSAFRLWAINSRSEAGESSAIRLAAIRALAGLNHCDHPAADDVFTQGMGWGDRGRTVYVLAAVRRMDGCPEAAVAVEAVVVRADVETGRILETRRTDDAREAWPTLHWSPVTPP